MSSTVFLLVLIVSSLLAAVVVVASLPRGCAGPVQVGLGVVRAVAEAESAGGVGDTSMVTVDVESVSGQRFTGRLRQRDDDGLAAALRPGVVLLVAFDPAARERLSLADDMLAVRADFDRMLVGKGLVSADEAALVRHGIRSQGVITATRETGISREDHCEVDLDLMVSRPGGGQFPAHTTTFVPESVLDNVSPGSVVATYHREGDESAIAVCVPPH
jgi:hypothetical protein